jgi:alkylmercury lyase
VSRFGPPERLVEALRPLDLRFTPEKQTAALATYRLLARGQAVTGHALAAELAWDPARARAFLDELPRAERDGDGRVIGFGGLTLRPTPHQLLLGAQVLHSWCAWDALFLPVVLGRPSFVRSRCAGSGVPVTLSVGPDAIADRHPATLTLSFARPGHDAPADVRGRFCSLVHFFADQAAAQEWAHHHPGTFPVDADDAFEVGREVVLARYRDALAGRGTRW